MVFKFGIFSGGVEHFVDSKVQSLVRPSKETTTMFKFESSKVHPVADLPLSLGTQPQNFGTQPHATFTSAPATPSAHVSGSGSKLPLGEVPNKKSYQRIIELQKLFLKNDGLFVWQKMGMRDKYTNLFVLTGTVFGMAAVFYEIGTQIFKKK